MKDKTFLRLTILFFVVLFAGIATVTFDKPISRMLRAKNEAPSSTKSFVLIFPITGAAGEENGKKQPTVIKITVTMRDVQGNVMPNRKVKLHSALPTVVIKPQDTLATDSYGQAVFTATSKLKGKADFEITDLESNIILSKKNGNIVPTVEFTQ